MKSFNKNALLYINFDDAVKYKIFPWNINSGILHVLIEEGREDAQIFLQELENKENIKIILEFAPLKNILRYINLYYSMVMKDEKAGEDIKNAYRSHSASVFLDKLLFWALKKRSGDIHMFYLTDLLLIRFRIDGMLNTFCFIDKNFGEDLIRAVKIRSNIEPSRVLKSKDGRMTYEYENGITDIRISIVPSIQGDKLHMRLLNDKNIPTDLENLIHDKAQKTLIETYLKKKSGFILITGPTGSGKSTSMRCFIDSLNDGEKHIMSVEDPVEYVIDGVTQIQTDNTENFHSALKSALRQDPDVLAIGEIRDGESCKVAVESALAGGYIIATLHTKNASSAVERMSGLGTDTTQLAASLGIIINQRLVRILCPNCRKEIEYDGEDIPSLKLKHKDKLFTQAGCEKCGYVGFVRRQSIFEIISVNDKMRLEIREHGTFKADNTQIETQVIQLLKNGEIILKDAFSLIGTDK